MLSHLPASTHGWTDVSTYSPENCVYLRPQYGRVVQISGIFPPARNTAEMPDLCLPRDMKRQILKPELSDRNQGVYALHA
jgi:hypothetical protein